MTRTNDSYYHVTKMLLRKSVLVISTFLYYDNHMVIKVGAEDQIRMTVVGNSGTVGDGELEGVLRDCILNNLFKFHRSKEQRNFNEV